MNRNDYTKSTKDSNILNFALKNSMEMHEFSVEITTVFLMVIESDLFDILEEKEFAL